VGSAHDGVDLRLPAGVGDLPLGVGQPLGGGRLHHVLEVAGQGALGEDGDPDALSGEAADLAVMPATFLSRSRTERNWTAATFSDFGGPVTGSAARGPTPSEAAWPAASEARRARIALATTGLIGIGDGSPARDGNLDPR
jgi:hypothetical protein